MSKNLLTDAAVKNAKPTTKPFKLFDGGGLYLLVKPNGAKAWRLKYRLGGKEGLFAVGTFPDMGLAESREARDAARVLVAKGIHPAHQRQEGQRQKLAKAEARRRGELLVTLRLRPDERQQAEALADRWRTSVGEALRRALAKAARQEGG
jgi:hypothetical protein